MSLAIVPVGQIFGRYEQQARIAELNKKTTVKIIQNQADQVTISSEARKAQVLGIARAVREASKSLLTESQNLDETKLDSDTDFEPLPISEGVVEKAIEQSSQSDK